MVFRKKPGSRTCWPHDNMLLRKTFNLPKSKTVGNMINKLRTGNISLKRAARKMKVDETAFREFLVHQKDLYTESASRRKAAVKTQSKGRNLDHDIIISPPRFHVYFRKRKWDFDEDKLIADFGISTNAEVLLVIDGLRRGMLPVGRSAKILGVHKRALFEFLTGKSENNKRLHCYEDMQKQELFHCIFKRGSVDFLRSHYGTHNSENDCILKALKKGEVSVNEIAPRYGRHGIDEDALMQFIDVLRHKEGIAVSDGQNLSDHEYGQYDFRRIEYNDCARDKDWILQTLQEGIISVNEAAELYGVD